MQNEKELAEAKKKAEEHPDDNSSLARDFMRFCPVPAIVADETGTVRFKTAEAAAILPELKDLDMLGAPIDFKELPPSSNGETSFFDLGHYRVEYFTAVNPGETGKHFVFLFFSDLSEAHNLREEAAENKSFVVLLHIAFDERFFCVKDSKQRDITGRIDKITAKFFERHNGYIKKISDTGYFAVLGEKDLRMMSERDYLIFLDALHSIRISDRQIFSVSMGIGRGGSGFNESEAIARDALRIAQNQGGDCVIISGCMNDTSFVCYGSDSSENVLNDVGYQSRIKRFTDELKKHIDASDNVIVMGHRNSDMDSVGAAVGLGGTLRDMGYSANVYVNRNNSVSKALLERLDKLEPKTQELFLDEESALEAINENTLLIVVDTRNVNQVDSRSIFGKAKRVIYIDHHKTREDEDINKTEKHIIDYQSIGASSASEIVTDIIRYLDPETPLSRYYAEALLAGIKLDTVKFSSKTSSNTFKAAAFLTALDADTREVDRLFNNSEFTNKLIEKFKSAVENYNSYAIACLDDESFSKSTAISNAELKMTVQKLTEAQGNDSAMSAEELKKAASEALAKEKMEGISIAASQAANQLLNSNGTNASFAVFRIGKNAVKISARSAGTVSGGANVEDIVKRLGGGGNINQAAAVITDKSLKEVCDMLRKALDDYDASMKSI
ncbi:MAG: DHH family phosphoesterase [Huintestinicola sp.]